MLRFNYQARDGVGQKVAGVMLADSEEELAVTLREMNVYLVSAKPEKSTGLSAIFAPRVKRRELINFTVHLATSIGASRPDTEGASVSLKFCTSQRPSLR